MDGSSASVDKKSDEVLFYNKPDLYGGSARYFIDDYEAASTISVTSGDNWTFGKSNLSMDTENEDSNINNNMKHQFRYTKVARDLTQNISKPASGNLQEKVLFSSNLHMYKCDKNDENDYDDTVIPPGTNKKYNNTDVDDALGDFDYLNEYQSDASNVSLCGSDASLRPIEKKVKHIDRNGRENILNINKDDVNTHTGNSNVNDVLGVFDYLNEYHSRTNSTSTASLYDSDDDMGLDNEIIPAANKNVDTVIENDKTNLDINKGDVWKETREDHTNVKSKHSDFLPKAFTGQGLLRSDIELNPDYENDFVRPIDSKKKDDITKTSHTDVEERRMVERKPYINIAYGFEDQGARSFRNAYPAYESNRTADNAVGGKRNMLDRARSEEVVSGYTHGEFILRRTQSEDQHGAFRQKPSVYTFCLIICSIIFI